MPKWSNDQMTKSLSLSPLHPQYPEKLKLIPQPPPTLYFRGNISLLKRPAIAVVGSRQATKYGLSVVKKLIPPLVRAGLVIVSGMARGIDTAAHWATLKNGGQTIGVLGCGLDVIYPRENADLYQQVNLLLSEFSPGTPPEAQNFPQRNRIIAALADAVLVIEAAQKSGTLITARQAVEMGKEVFAVPGPITSPQSEGTAWLIQQGAKLIYKIDDILEEL